MNLLQPLLVANVHPTVELGRDGRDLEHDAFLRRDLPVRGARRLEQMCRLELGIDHLQAAAVDALEVEGVRDDGEAEHGRHLESEQRLRPLLAQALACPLLRVLKNRGRR